MTTGYSCILEYGGYSKLTDNLTSIINAGSFYSWTLLATLGDWNGSFNVLTGTDLFSGLITLTVWINFESPAVTVVYVAPFCILPVFWWKGKAIDTNDIWQERTVFTIYINCTRQAGELVHGYQMARRSLSILQWRWWTRFVL